MKIMEKEVQGLEGQSEEVHRRFRGVPEGAAREKGPEYYLKRPRLTIFQN